MSYRLTLVLFFAASEAFAAAAVVDTSALESVDLHGVYLGMPAKQAFTTLTNAGFKAGPISNYEDWTGEGLELVRGDGQGPEGEARLLLLRRGDKVIQLSETFIRTRGERFSPESEITRLQQILGLPADNTHCHVAPSGSGICEARDHSEVANAQTSLTISISPIMRQSVLMRREALKPAGSNQ